MDSRYDRQRDGRRRRFDDRSDDRFFDDRFRDGHPQPPPPRRRHFDIHSTYSDDDGDYHRGHRGHASSWRSEGGSRRRSSNPWDGHDASRFFRGSGRGHSGHFNQGPSTTRKIELWHGRQTTALPLPKFAKDQERPVLTVHPKISQRNPETNTVTIKNASMREELVNELGTLDQQLGWVSQVREAPRQQIKLINSKGALLNNQSLDGTFNVVRSSSVTMMYVLGSEMLSSQQPPPMPAGAPAQGQPAPQPAPQPPDPGVAPQPPDPQAAQGPQGRPPAAAAPAAGVAPDEPPPWVASMIAVVMPSLVAEASRGIGAAMGTALRQDRQDARAEEEENRRRAERAARARQNSAAEAQRRQQAFASSPAGAELEGANAEEMAAETAPGGVGSRCRACRTGAPALVRDMPCGHFGYCVNCQSRRVMRSMFRAGPKCAVCQAEVESVDTALADAAAEQQLGQQ